MNGGGIASNMLDVPNFFWESEPTLYPLYIAVREYLEIKPRIQVLNERCRVFLDLAEILSDSIADNKTSRASPIPLIYKVLTNNDRSNLDNHRADCDIHYCYYIRSVFEVWAVVYEGGNFSSTDRAGDSLSGIEGWIWGGEVFVSGMIWPCMYVYLLLWYFSYFPVN